MNEISAGVIAATWICAILCFLLPLGGFILMQVRRMKVGMSFLWGVLLYLGISFLVRNLLMNMFLPAFPWFGALASRPWAYALLFGAVTGVLDECARAVILINFVKPDKRRLADGLAMGLGQGGTQAMIMVGVGLFSNLFAFSAVNSGAYLELEAAAAQEILASALSISAGSTFLVTFEQALAVVAHAAYSLILIAGIREGRAPQAFFAALGIHVLYECVAALLPACFAMSDPAIAAMLLVLTLPLGWIVYRLFIRMGQKEAHA